MDADWMYASYHFSHPILPERLGELGWYGEKNKELREQMDATKEKKKKDEATVLKAGDREL
jgi:STE24 endopeptidase